MRNLHTSRTSSKEPTSYSSSSARMPYDRSTSSSSSTTTAAAAPSLSSRQHPQMPTLAKRATLTPKLAANKPPPTSASNRQTVTLATPVPRKSARPDSYIGGATAAASIKDNHASPTPNYFQNSLTPRSGPRQSRVDSPSSSSSPADPSVDINWDTRSGLGIAAATAATAAGLEADGRQRNGPPSTNRDSKFFYASDAPRSAQPIPAPAPTPKPALPQKGPVFFYANGDNLPAKPSPPTSVPAASFSPPLASSGPDPRDSKFMYANGTPDLQPSLMMTSGSGSVVSTSSRVTSTRPGSGPQSPAAYMPQRTTSPPKISGHPPPPPAPPSQSSAGPSIAERRNMIALSTPQLGRSKTDLRRISAEAPPRRASGHSRSGSLVAEPASATRPATSSPPVNSPLPSPMSFSNPTISMASVLQAADDFAGEADDNESMASGLASPRSANGNDPLSELVANARRERKVQDLQITNASLEAINRTLERQLRKQTNELRRYKRMSRAARLSSVNTAKASSRVPSDSVLGETPEGPLNDLALSDLSEDSEADPEDGYLDESELSESDSTGSAQTGPSTAMRDARHRKHDEKRLQVDLSKHQQLLVDSQKMNQSLKRCLGWTEELIREGKRALEYQVRISEVDISGRVAPEEGEQPYIYDGAELWDHNQESDRNPDSDGEPGHSGGEADGDADETMRLRIERLRPADESDGNKNAQDRDSGIVLPGDGSQCSGCNE
ncbi:hypothetical protein VP1G_03133 [Cytospora mali]|uniref:Uncharacterized protein n=1 Tax=Cytospora mali TaxID=578113 RepID=A0A194UVY8_CYTMA|nr:hypothetical protein VP1G_03133 [Valsa mali var. pyri (nom. inval.)]